MWGTPCVYLFKTFVVRITPTCVGNTEYGEMEILEDRDHPHLCGEHKTLFTDDTEKMGITPTCVGNTLSIVTLSPLLKDHPHLCGEH